MKLPVLLSQYLYQFKKLDLPGIGSFAMDPAAVVPEPSDRGHQTPASGITFKNTVIKEPSDSLIDFLKEHTGKMRPLVASDLDFFLTTSKQLLNIGKSLYLEGIGTLQKNNEGNLEFTPGEYTSVRLEDLDKDKRKPAASLEEAPREYEPKSNNFRQVILLTVIVIGLGAIGWGGYYLYKKNTYIDPATETAATSQEQPSVARVDSNTQQAPQQPATTAATSTDSAANNVSRKPIDSVKPATTVQPAAPIVEKPAPTPGVGETLYKFVILETDRKGRALRRYNQLLGYQLNIKMEQKDSAYFKLYFPIPATPRDTLHIRDSLMDVYAAQVRIEQ